MLLHRSPMPVVEEQSEEAEVVSEGRVGGLRRFLGGERLDQDEIDLEGNT